MRSCPPANSARPLIDTHGCVKNLHSEEDFRLAMFGDHLGDHLEIQQLTGTVSD
jgi:hypothetical protein